MFDWFLVEIGKQLINSSDSDLVNILLLNRAINKRATPIFRHHFLNVNLQNEILVLISENKLEKVQEMFEKNPFSLNPNIFCKREHFKSNNEDVHFLKISKCVMATSKVSLSCFHDPKVIDFFQFDCDCARISPFHLSMLACFENLGSLVRSLLFHPRFNFDTLSVEESSQVIFGKHKSKL